MRYECIASPRPAAARKAPHHEHEGEMAKDRIRKAYADTPDGQVHYRAAGPQDGPGVVLIHWTPLSSRMYAPLIETLAGQGFRVCAPDLLGYGRSDPRPERWSFADWARTCRIAGEAAGIRKAHVVGGHTGACVAVELAVEHHDFVSTVALDGCPFLTTELAAVFAKMAVTPRPSPQADGSHERLAWAAAAGALHHLIPGFVADAVGIERVWPVMIDYLETDFVSSAPLSAAYDVAVRLPKIGQPILLLGAAQDTLAASFAQARKIRPDADHFFFPGHHPVHFPEEAEAYAAVLRDFFEAGAGGGLSGSPTAS
jgi:pimeloyl-ACP methyl ester carboxylesterase